MLAPLECGPIDEACPRQLARFAAEPALALQERDERLLLDDYAHAAVEDRIPDDTREKRGNCRRLFRQWHGP